MYRRLRSKSVHFLGTCEKKNCCAIPNSDFFCGKSRGHKQQLLMGPLVSIYYFCLQQMRHDGAPEPIYRHDSVLCTFWVRVKRKTAAQNQILIFPASKTLLLWKPQLRSGSRFTCTKKVHRPGFEFRIHFDISLQICSEKY